MGMASGDITIDICVTGSNIGTLTLNGDTHSCTFGVQDNKLVIKANSIDGEIDVDFWHRGMRVTGRGAPHNIWIGQD